MAGSLGLSEIGQLAVTVTNLERATAFYRDALGMQLLFEAPGMAFFQCGGVQLMLGTAQGRDYPSHIIYYRVDDISAARETLTERGVEFVQEPHVVHRTKSSQLWLAFFRDIDGNTLALMSEAPVK